MSEGKNAKLIAEARALANGPMLGKSQWRELDKSILMNRRLVDALEAAEQEKTAALAVIEQVKAIYVRDLDTSTEDFDNPDVTLDEIWVATQTIPADALVELKRAIAERAWSEGHSQAMANVAWPKERKDSPYRANPEATDSTNGGDR